MDVCCPLVAKTTLNPECYRPPVDEDADEDDQAEDGERGDDGQRNDSFPLSFPDGADSRLMAAVTGIWRREKRRK